ncbi:hypothetical protein N0V93_002949 [Gnomoniopsis smithogilvyi]|uniref:Tyrosinase copper-binding domain-containing protein n=1 Tax=Gnomoniopsis smithogilvyi TaxID=1191159 RepID=A0A9W9CZN4_9PEZI|nr:hypothetical protein N0V93_002949 [Gnomoniopsis smithogilvyi]
MKHSKYLGLVLGGALVSGSTTSTRHNASSTCTDLKQRKAWHTLSDLEKGDFLGAVKCLMTSAPRVGIEGAESIWDELQYCHVAQANYIHYVGGFLPWHRYYLHAFETLLKDECGFTGGVPYWDEQRDFEVLSNIENASIWGSDNLSFGTNGENGAGCVIDGPFANTTLRMNAAWGVINNTEYCLARQFDQTMWLDVNQSYVDACYLSEDYETANGCYLLQPHDGGHLATGGAPGVGVGTMSSQAASPGDPVFFVHHANLDRLWWQWQKGNLSARLTDMGGVNVPPEENRIAQQWLYPSSAVLDYDGDPGNVTTLSHVLSMVGLVPNATIAEVMDLHNDLNCAIYIE